MQADASTPSAPLSGGAETREFVVSGALLPGDVQGLMPAGLRAQQDRRTRLRRVWLDTADGRLAKRGLVLVHVSDGDRRLLTLDGPAETVSVAAGDGPPQWPADLPAAVASRVAGLMGLRVLLPLRTEEGPASVLRLLDSEAKTVGRVWLEKKTTRGGPQTLRLESLRGYGRHASRVAKALAGDPRFSPSTAPAPSAPRLPQSPALTRDVPATHAVVAVLAYQFDVVEANIDGTSAALDTEFLHDLRVAVRRSRSALKVTADVLPARFAARFGPRLRWLGDLTTPARDLDVLVLEIPALVSALPDDARHDLEPLRLMLEERLRQSYVVLGKGIRSARFRQLAVGYRAELGKLAATAASGPLAGAAADRWATAAMQKVLKRGARITEMSAPEALHDLCKRCKELRYCLELFEPLWDAANLRRFVTELKALQENLGAFQDSEIQSATLRQHAEELATAAHAPTSTVIAIGRLTVHFESSQRAARAEFADRFNRFGSPGNRRRFAALTGGT
jgi:CHAD domain-containing protein